jgi:hypothetical protein
MEILQSKDSLATVSGYLAPHKKTLPMTRVVFPSQISLANLGDRFIHRERLRHRSKNESIQESTTAEKKSHAPILPPSKRQPCCFKIWTRRMMI